MHCLIVMPAGYLHQFNRIGIAMPAYSAFSLLINMYPIHKI